MSTIAQTINQRFLAEREGQSRKAKDVKIHARWSNLLLAAGASLAGLGYFALLATYGFFAFVYSIFAAPGTG